MQVLSKILRSLALVFLTGGSSAIVFAAVVLVKAAKAKGVPVEEAAAVNAPVFIQYGKVALVCAILLLVAEGIGFMKNSNKTKLDYCLYASSLICVIAVAVFSLGIVPPMEQMLPTLSSNHEEFAKLHKLSQMIFGTSMLAGFVSLILPVFKKDSAN